MTELVTEQDVVDAPAPEGPSLNEVRAERLVRQDLEDPKATLGIYTLPCGFIDSAGRLHVEVEVVEMTGAEEDLLASRQVSAARKFPELINRCTKRVGTLVGAAVREALLDFTVGDRAFLLFALRRASLGDAYPFVTRCGVCNVESLFTLDLRDLGTKDMPTPMQRVYETKLPSKKTITWHVMTARDEDRFATLDKSGFDSISLQILVRVDRVDGVPVLTEVRHGKSPALTQIKALSMRDRNALREAFEATEGGVDTAMDLTCPSCQAVWEENVDIAQLGFFFPDRVFNTWKKKSSG